MKTHLPKKLMNIFVCPILMLTAFTATAQVTPTSNIIYVKAGASGNGSSWSNPVDLAIALQWAQANKDNNLWDGTNPLKIYVAKGIYKPGIDPGTNAVPAIGQKRDATFLMVKNVQLYGGFPDNGTPGINDRDWNANPTVLSGDLGTVNDNTDNAYHVVISAGDVATTALNGFTITGANADGGGYITINEHAVDRDIGGGIYNYSSSPALANLSISQNTATSRGGGISNNLNSSPALTNVSISGNTATSGGGICNNTYSYPNLVNVSISGNTANYGGGMFNSLSSSPTLTNVSISGNTAIDGGGIFNNDSSSPTLTNLSISGNTANNGGGIYNNYSSPTLTNLSISGNTATSGGGIYNNGSSPTLTNLSISGNTANNGGGIYNNFSSPVLSNNIVWGNGTGTSIYGDAINASSNNNLIEGGTTGNIANIPIGLTVTDIFTAPQDASTAPSTAGDYSLKTGSIAIDAGDNSLYAGLDASTVDLAGKPRVFKFTSGGKIDLGAYELQIIKPDANGIVYVSTTGKGDQSGDSWTNASSDLQRAINASDVQQVWVSAGTYKPRYRADNMSGASANDRDNAFVLKKDVKIYGGFAGTESLLTQRDSTRQSNNTILSGDLGTVNNNTDNTYHVVISVGDAGTATLNGFTITEAKADGSGTITVNGQSVSKNSGGGMYNYSSSPTLVNLSISGNTANYGGGMYNYRYSSPALANLSISGNTANYGGGMYNISSSPTLANVTISGNTANNSGGGIFNISSFSPTLTNVSISGNTAINGGGMYNSYTSPNIYNTILVGNNSGIYEENGSVLVIKHSLIQGLNSTTDGNISAAGITALDIFVDPQSPGLSTAGDYSLKTGSIAVNAGNNSLYAGLDENTLDLAGKPRVFKFNNGGKIDLGAYEYQLPVIKPDADGIIYVSTTGKGDESGDSWTNASGDLQKAINAGDVQQVWVSAGTYKPRYRSDNMSGANANDRDNAFVLKKDVKIYGGFAGTESLLTQRDSTGITNATILSGDIGTVDDIADNAYHVVISADDVGSAELNGFTVTEAKADGSTFLTVNGQQVYRSYGGGIYNSSSSPALANLSISGNTANGGGGIYNYSSSPILANLSISGNTANGGGGIFNDFFSSPTLTNLTISGNTATNSGGGMCNSGSFPILSNVSISGNTATTNGGGMYNSDSSPTLVNVSISGNTAGNGGGMFNNVSSPTLSNSIVWGNGTGTSIYGGINASSSNNLIEGGTTGNIANIPVGLTVADIFVDPQDASTAPSTAGNYSLKTGSIAIDAGDNSLYTGLDASTVDLAGNPRVYKFTSGGIIDLGAYELQIIKPDANGIVYVSTTGNGDESGDSWTNASGDLQKAINASDVQQVWVSAGTYKPQYRADNWSGADTNDRNNAFVLKKNVKIYGGFAGTESLLTERDSTGITNATILSGDIGTVDDIADNAYHVVISADDVGGAELNGFTIIDGNANGSFSSTITVNGQLVYGIFGGGIYNESSSPALANLSISGNISVTSGGGMFNNSASSLTLTNVSISGNIAGYGGGMYNLSSSPTLSNVSISGNTAHINGGGIFNESSSPVLTNLTISGNTATNSGGGMYNDGSAPVLTNSIVWGNNSGIYEENGSVSAIKYSLIQGLANTDNGNIADTDPKFVSTTDFRLQAGSPAIDKGDPNTNNNGYIVQAGTTDLAGATRLQNGRIDMGAYERIAILPVTLVSYIAKAQNDAVQLQWKTASERNNKGFVLYRSGDDEVFTKIGFINGKDNSSASDSYYFYDKQPLSGNNYYRLVQVDNNGKETDLGLRTATFNFQPSTFNLYPNPTADIVTATFQAGRYQSLEAVDLNGRVLQHIALNASESRKELSLGDYPAGTYLITLKTNGHTEVLKAIRK